MSLVVHHPRRERIVRKKKPEDGFALAQSFLGTAPLNRQRNVAADGIKKLEVAHVVGAFVLIVLHNENADGRSRAFSAALPAMRETASRPVQLLLAAQDGQTRIAESAWRCPCEKQTRYNSARLSAEEALYQTDLQKRESKKCLRWGHGERRSNSRRKGLFSTPDGYRQAVGPGWPSDLMRGRLPR